MARTQSDGLTLDRLGPPLARTFGLTSDQLLDAFRPATPADIPGLLELRQRVIGTDLWWDDDAYVRWRYFDREYGGEPRPCWVLALGNQIVGALGLEPVTLVVDGVPHAATRTLDIMVRPDVEGRGVGGFMNLALLRQFPVTMVTGSNDRSHRLICRTWEHVLDLYAWKLPITAAPYLERRFGRPVAVALGPAMDLLLAWQRTRRAGAPSGTDIREVAAFDDSFDVVSRSAERPDAIVVRRAAGYLNWRFVRDPRCAYRMLAAYVGARPVAYVVSRFNRSRPNPARQAEIVEWQAEPEHGAGPLRALLSETVRRLASDGARLIAAMCSRGADTGPLAAVGFRERPAERLPFFVRAADPALHARLARADRWTVTLADFDVE